ncbi:uncharacterized protein LOC127718492 isoform X2 [Mytilus californianus]|uniref:uncharacterized protein LOC127718492 isoform X2 n=1 Tax=Mytilus californianus TaxID=6549 RepID=UPI00224655EF|nr:uncharacterized protein LOC127718492 isoform X2 [Mytilus californianus]
MKLGGVIFVLCCVGALGFNGYRRSRGENPTPIGGELPQFESEEFETKSMKSPYPGNGGGQNSEYRRTYGRDMMGLDGEISVTGQSEQTSGQSNFGPSGEISDENTPDLSGEISYENTPDLSGEISDENTPGLSGEISDENTPDLSGEISYENTPDLSGEISDENTPGLSGEISDENTPEPSIEMSSESTPISSPTPSIYNFFRRKSGKPFTPSSSGESGSSEDESGEDKNKCMKPEFYKLLSVFRRFPNTDSREMNGYEAVVYEPFLDQFWNTKDKVGLDQALDIFMKDFSRSLFVERYRCKGTQLNQILISILKNRSNRLMSEGKKSIQSAVDQIKPKSNAAQYSNKDRSDMKKTRTNDREIVGKAFNVLRDVLYKNSINHLETRELGDVACYLRFVRENIKKEAEADDTTLQQIKQQLSDWSTKDFPEVFQCTYPLSVVEIYEENWKMINLPEEKNELFQLVSRSLKKFIPKYRQPLQIVLSRTIQKFVVRVFKELKPFHDVQSADEMVGFFQKFLPSDKLQFAEKLIRSLDIFGNMEMSSESTPKSTPTQSIYKSFRRINGRKTTPSPSGESGSSEDESGSSEEKDKCMKPAFYKLLSVFRRFPNMDSKELNGYEAAVYEPLLDDFWTKKDQIGLKRALRQFMRDFSKSLLTERYKCKGTQLNQMMIAMLRNTTSKFISGAWKEIQSVIDKMGTSKSYANPSVDERRARGGKNDMKDPNSRRGKIVRKVFWVLKKVLRRDVADHMETEELHDVACYLEFVRKEIRSEVETGASLEQIKHQLAKWSTQLYPDVFECTDPRRVVDIYDEEWRDVNLPEEENKLFQHFSKILKKIVPKVGKGRQSVTKVVDSLHITLTRTIHKFAMKVITELKPFLDARSTSEMLAFFRKFVSSEKMQFAEKLIRSLDIFDTPTMAPTEAPTMAPTEAPTMARREAPTMAPTQAKTKAPTQAKTKAPTQAPTKAPTQAPTMAPTQAPTMAPKRFNYQKRYILQKIKDYLSKRRQFE